MNVTDRRTAEHREYILPLVGAYWKLATGTGTRRQ